MREIKGFFKQFTDKKQYVIYGYHPPMLAKYLHDVVTEDRYLAHKDFYDKKYHVELEKKENYNKKLYNLYDVIKNPDGTIKDFRTVESFKDMIDCGFNVLYLQKNAAIYEGDDFETSEIKAVLDKAYEAGYKRRAVIRDERLHELSARENPIIGEGAQFASFDELVSYCKECIAPYKDHPAFGGVYLLDEPTWKPLPQLCQVYKALNQIDDNMFVQFNLLPMAGDANAVVGTGSTSAGLFVDESKEENKNLTVAQAYRKYLETFAILSEADNITMDSYPIREKGPYADKGNYIDKDYYLNGNAPKLEKEYYVQKTHFPTLQSLAEVCAKYGCIMGGLSNSCAMQKVRDDCDNVLVHCHKQPDEMDMRYQLNAYMAFGVKIFSYYTYWAKRDNGPGCYHVENTTFIAQDGTKLPLYYFMQKIHAEMAELAEILYDYNYSAMTWLGEKVPFLSDCEKNHLQFIKSACLLNGDSCIITELKTVDGKYMYAVYNSNPPKANGDSVDISVEVVFDGIKGAKQLCGTEFKSLSLDGNKVVINLSYAGVAFVTVE